jgi:NitT/TauT family transport system substrate-binding protein
MRTQTRRQFLTTLSLAGAAGFVSPMGAMAGEEPLETTAIRLPKTPAICIAPSYAAEELLRAEGFTDIRYVDLSEATAFPIEAVARGEIDFNLNYSINYVSAIASGKLVTLLAGVHVGCYELFAAKGIRTIADLKGKSVGVGAVGSVGSLLVTMMAAHVGLDPAKDINWVTDPKVKPIELFEQGKVDAFLGFPPEAQDLRARRIGSVIVNSAIDHPWSEYFCCMVGANPEYVRNHPVATKRALRAILKATDLCATDPARAARRLVDGGYTPRYDYALEALQEIPYDRWREYDPEDTVRARSGLYQIKPAEDHCRKHRLAFSERAQTRAEGLRGRYRNAVD